MLTLITRADAGVSIMRLLESAEVDQEIAKWQLCHPGEYVSHRDVSESDIPQDRTFRNAWGQDLACDMPKAKEIWRQKIREHRAPVLAALDVEFMRADEAGDTTAKKTIAARKQALRDATQYPAIEDAKTPDQLKAAWPQCLGERQ